MARIKKIMQSDEEGGKIAAATPILISKCLELFMQDLIENTSKITREKNSQTMSSAHLKQCINATERFDFLSEIVKRAPDTEPEKESKRGRPRKTITKVESGEAPSRGAGRRGKRGRPPGVKSSRTLKVEGGQGNSHLPPPPVPADFMGKISSDKTERTVIPPISEISVDSSRPFHFPSVQSAAGLPPVNIFNSDNQISF